jgi:hypothetical protein
MFNMLTLIVEETAFQLMSNINH